jgi:hypothetical protein
MQSSRILYWANMALLGACAATPVAAQSIDTYLPASVTGADVEPGVTVLSRERPGYDPPGLRIGDWTVEGSVWETAGDNTNVTGYDTGRASAFLDTRATGEAVAQWAEDRFAADMLVEDDDYLQQAHQSFANWTATLADTHMFGDSSAAVAYSHLSLHQIASDFGALQADAPVGYQVDDLRVFGTVALSRFTLIPLLDVQYVRDSDASVLGVPVSLGYEARTVVTQGAELRYALTDRRSLVVVGQGIETEYGQRPTDQPTESSTSFRLLAGLDTTARGVWRARVLLGAEVRSFAASAYATRWSPIAEGSLIWTPDGMTTATLGLTRTIADPADFGVQGYNLTKVSLVLDRELRRNLLLAASVGVQTADPLHSGASQTNVLAGLSLTRLISRHLRVVVSYSFDAQRGDDVVFSAGPGHPSAVRGGNYDRQLAGVSVRLAL